MTGDRDRSDFQIEMESGARRRFGSATRAASDQSALSSFQPR